MGILWDMPPANGPWICLGCRKPFWNVKKYRRHLRKGH